MKTIGALFLAFALAGCSCKPDVVEPDVDPTASRSTSVYVVSHDWHASLIIPGDQVNLAIPDLKDRFGEVAYYEIGWGDEGFYQASEITTGLTLQAMFRSKGAVIHIVAVPSSPTEYFSGSEVIETCINQAEADSLRTFVANSFVYDSAGHVIMLAKGIYGDSQFYEGEGRYNLLNTCNKWTAKGLSSAGMDISPTLKLTSDSVMHYMKSNRNNCPIPNAAGP